MHIATPKSFRRLTRNMPAKARIFLFRAILLVGGWNLLYLLILKPLGIPDTQLTYAVQHGTGYLLGQLGNIISYETNGIYIDGIRSINIAPQCNGLELIVLYLGFLLCFPARTGKLIAYALPGTVMIYILNVLRCALLAYMYHNNHPLTDFAHHYAFKLVVYGFVFGGWILYTRKNNYHAKN